MSTPRPLTFTVGSSLLTASLSLGIAGCDKQGDDKRSAPTVNPAPEQQPQPSTGDEGPTVNPAPEPTPEPAPEPGPEPINVNEGPEPMPEPAPDIKVNPGPNPAYDTTAPKPPGQLP